MKSNAFIQYCSYWTKRSMKWLYHYTLMEVGEKWRSISWSCFLQLASQLLIKCVQKYQYHQFHCYAEALENLYFLIVTERTFYHFFTLISGIFVGRAMHRSLESLNNKELRFILGDYSFPTKQFSH